MNELLSLGIVINNNELHFYANKLNSWWLTIIVLHELGHCYLSQMNAFAPLKRAR
jgi:hypothetical protein